MWIEEDMVGSDEAWELDVVEELKVEGRKNLFAIFSIDATMQDGDKRKRAVLKLWMLDFILFYFIYFLFILSSFSFLFYLGLGFNMTSQLSQISHTSLSQ